jgi:hypothetical protein
MINRIMTTRAAVLALAAPLLLTAPALADNGHSKGKRANATISIGNGHSGITVSTSNRGYNTYGYNRSYGHSNRGYSRGYGYRVNEWGQSQREVKQLKRQAVRACRQAIRQEANYKGFRDVDFDDGRRAYQNGPVGFRVTFNEVEFEGRRRDFERPVTCQVRNGTQVKWIDGIPQRGKRGHRRNSSYRY